MECDQGFLNAKETNKTKQEDASPARPYQVELLERAKEKNIIVCLGTGTGKTFISVMLIKELAHQVRNSFKNGGKRTFFLVNTVPLANQQAKVIDRHTDLSVKHYIGEMGVDLWEKAQWEKEFSEHNVLVMTAQIFLDLLHHGHIGLSQVNLLIFDECHHAKKRDPYKQIMQLFDVCPPHQYPKILGLTASIVNGKVKPWKLEAEIHELEATLRSTCETSLDEEIEIYAAKPTEQIITFDQGNISEDNAILIQMLGDVIKPSLEFLNDCRVQPTNEAVKNTHTFAKFTLRECSESLESLGPWAAYRVAEYLIKDIDRACKFQDDKQGLLFCELCGTTLRQLQSVYCNFTLQDSSADPNVDGVFYIMPKLQKLLSVLKEYRDKEESEDGSKLCGIVFVERRYTALALSEQINIIAKQDHELKFLESNFVTGHCAGGRVNYSNQTDMNFKKQESILGKFREHEFNLLIATSVVEEGLDIPKCNVVCRFDFPNNYRSYVQSKGRARAKNSKYIMLVEKQEKEEKEIDLELFCEIENYLSTMCHDRTLPSEEESIEAVDTDHLPPYMPRKGERGTRVTMSSAISLLCRYCSRLPGDSFTRLKPVFKIEEVGREAYRCILQMPNNCPLRDSIWGPPMPRKNLAKMAAALRTCELLHKMGELDDNLLPVITLSDEESEEEEKDETESRDGKAGTKKRRRLYERKIPDAFRNSLPQKRCSLHLTVTDMHITRLTNPRDLEVSRQCFVDDHCQKFGILTRIPLSPVRPFKLFPDYGEVTVSLKPSVPLNDDIDLDIVQKFHCLLFSHVLRTLVEVHPGSVDGFFIVLLTPRCSVDTRRMKDILSLDPLSDLVTTQLIDAVVTKRYDETRKHKEHLAVTKVRQDLSARSPFPDRSKARTFEEYFIKQYGLRIKELDQPLIEVKHLSGRVNFLVERDKTEKQNSFRHLPPELCHVEILPASLLSVSAMLPSILHRVSSLLLVRDLRRTISGAYGQLCDDKHEAQLAPIGVDHSNNAEWNIGSSVGSTSILAGTMEVEVAIEPGILSPGLCTKLKEIFPNRGRIDLVPDSALVLQALTTTHAGDAFNLERLEMLGDAFLKLAVSLYLFCTYQNKDEGKLTERKVRQLSNLALFRAAEKKSLAAYLQSTQLARDVWCPIGCRVIENTIAQGSEPMDVDHESTRGTGDVHMEFEEGSIGGTEHARCSRTTQRISDKCVADSVEGLIGAYLISCGYTGALHFMNFLGLKVLPEDIASHGHDNESAKSGKYAVFTVDPPSLLGKEPSEDMLNIMTSGLESFEKCINYRFQSKLYLLEALTHASYHANRVTYCYQRLEFLGDALLDFLVTQHLYFRHANLSPGQLTDVRQALVNNNIFATIAVKFQYHKFLKQMSPQWFKTIEKFIKRVEEETTDGKVTADSFIIVSEEDEEGIEAPKVLGDIFESVAGAVFLDSGMDLTTTWRVYYQMMKPYIDNYSHRVPINPIRGVYENDSDAKFSDAEDLGDGRIKRTLRVSWGEFVGKGANSRIAKVTAAKLALKNLQLPKDTY